MFETNLLGEASFWLCDAQWEVSSPSYFWLHFHLHVLHFELVIKMVVML